MTPLDAQKFKPNEGGPSFPLKHRLIRAMWNATWLLLASWTPPPMHPWRRFLLRAFGATIRGKSDVRGSARVWYPANLLMEQNSIIAARVICYNMAPVYIGEGAIISQGAHLCAGSHNIRDENFQLVVKPIHIGKKSWIAAEAFVGPGVEVGDFAVLGARGVTFRHLEDHGVYVGNPAIKVSSRIVV
ncbi:putative colanic acid biosynthesis acetyltransferase [Oryzifoliimicrobium ureilyticus]|uniref:putative colanic acid biosynthesis acetyltransferase n=1 Tax=Oryzifoliimicrobium ureilyticus TaxID=3113724 RepID=UPI0030761B1A